MTQPSQAIAWSLVLLTVGMWLLLAGQCRDVRQDQQSTVGVQYAD